MKFRLFAALVAATLTLTACGSDSDGSQTVPDDQVLKPAETTPSGLEATELDGLSIAVPSAWDKQPEANPAKNVTSTVWRGPVTDDVATDGAEVRVITDPQQNADKAATSLAVSAMAMLGGRKVEPVEVVWPGATSAYFIAYEAEAPQNPGPSASPSKTPAEIPPLLTRTLVLDLEDGTQIQVTAISADGPELPEQVLSSVTVDSNSAS